MLSLLALDGLRDWPGKPVVYEDMATGQNEWRNIQDIVRYTFQAFHEVLRTHGEAINSLESTLEDKASRKELADGLHARVSAKDLTARLKKVEAQVATKVGPDALEAHRIDIGAALQLHTAAVQSQLDQKANDAELQDLRAQQAKTSERLQHLETQLRGQLEQLEQDLTSAVASLRAETGQSLDSKADAATVTAALAHKADAATVRSALQSKADTAAVNAALGTKAEATAVELMLSSKADKAAVKAGLSSKADAADVEVMLGSKASKAAVEAAVHSLRKADSSLMGVCGGLTDRIAADRDTTSTALQSLSATFDDAIADIRTHAAATSASTTDRLAWVEAELTREADRHHKALLAHKADLAALHADLAMKADGERVSQLSASQQETLATLRRQLEAKAEVADMCALLDAKANVEDVNKALLEVSDELSRKIASDELQRALQDKLASPSSVCSDCCLGRWLWKTSKTKSGGAVPWNVQSVNSDPVNLVWEQDKVSIMVVVPGLYEVAWGFYSKQRPIVQLMLNGDPVTATPSTSSYALPRSSRSSGSERSQSSQQSGSVVSLTMIDFLALPAKACIALTYRGQDRGQGFLSLRKL